MTEYRRGARKQLHATIRSLDNELYHSAGEVLPLSARLTYGGGSRRTRIATYDEMMRLRAVVCDTRPRALLIREWQGESLTAQISLWSYQPTACALDELRHALWCHEDVATEKGVIGGFDRFIATLQGVKDLRSQYRGMIKYGLSPNVSMSACQEEAWLDALLLPGSLEEATARLRKELDCALAPYPDSAEPDWARREYSYLLEEGRPEEFRDLLQPLEQALFDTVGLPTRLWREVARLRLGIVANEPEPIEPVIRLAQVIPLRPRRPRRSQEQYTELASAH